MEGNCKVSFGRFFSLMSILSISLFSVGDFSVSVHGGEGNCTLCAGMAELRICCLSGHGGMFWKDGG